MRTVTSTRMRTLIGVSVIALVAGVVPGCGVAPVPEVAGASQLDPASGEVAPVQSPVIEGKYDNDEFERAQPATLPASGEIMIEGILETYDDVDLYALGPATAGDLIVIDVTGHEGLNTVAALIDDRQDLIIANDNRGIYIGQEDPLINQTLRAGTDSLYLGVVVSGRSRYVSDPTSFSARSYTVRARREPAQGIAAPQPQLVWLDFEGGASVQIGLTFIEEMRPFSAEAISARFTGETEYVIALVAERMRQDLADYNVTLLDSRHDAPPTEPHTRLFFGNTSERYLGLADMVDVGNAFVEQEAIIYAENLALIEYLMPDVDVLARALANIASHELGHLLGLEHTAGLGSLMATGFSVTRILERDGSFVRTYLHSSVFPLGWQNGPAMLLRNVGPNPQGGAGARLRLEDLLPLPDPVYPEPIRLWECGACSPGAGGG